MSLTVELARARDEPELRRLVSETPMPGAITVAFEREPDFGRGAAVEGKRVDVVVARAGERAVGLVCHARRDLFVNGEVTELGYLGMLRIRPGHPVAGVLRSHR